MNRSFLDQATTKIKTLHGKLFRLNIRRVFSSISELMSISELLDVASEAISQVKQVMKTSG